MTSARVPLAVSSIAHMRNIRDSINYAISNRNIVTIANTSISISSIRINIITTTATTITASTAAIRIITSIRTSRQKAIFTVYRPIGSQPGLGMPRLMGRHLMDDQGWAWQPALRLWRCAHACEDACGALAATTLKSTTDMLAQCANWAAAPTYACVPAVLACSRQDQSIARQW